MLICTTVSEFIPCASAYYNESLLNYFITALTLFGQVAEYYSNTDKKSVLIGGMATFDVYSFPDVNRIDQLTSTSITVAHDNSPEFNSMLAGWMVSFRPLVRI